MAFQHSHYHNQFSSPYKPSQPSPSFGGRGENYLGHGGASTTPPSYRSPYSQHGGVSKVQMATAGAGTHPSHTRHSQDYRMNVHADFPPSGLLAHQPLAQPPPPPEVPPPQQHQPRQERRSPTPTSSDPIRKDTSTSPFPTTPSPSPPPFSIAFNPTSSSPTTPFAHGGSSPPHMARRPKERGRVTPQQPNGYHATGPSVDLPLREPPGTNPHPFHGAIPPHAKQPFPPPYAVWSTAPTPPPSLTPPVTPQQRGRSRTPPSRRPTQTSKSPSAGALVVPSRPHSQDPPLSRRSVGLGNSSTQSPPPGSTVQEWCQRARLAFRQGAARFYLEKNGSNIQSRRGWGSMHDDMATRLDFAAVQSLLGSKELGCHVTTGFLRNHWEEARSNWTQDQGRGNDEGDPTQQGVTEDEFVALYCQLWMRPELAPLFNQFATPVSTQHHHSHSNHNSLLPLPPGEEGSHHMTVSSCLEFLSKVQGETLSEEVIRRRFGLAEEWEGDMEGEMRTSPLSYSPFGSVRGPRPVGPATSLSMHRFASFLADSNHNSWWKPDDEGQIHHDMTQPLSHYFIRTAHIIPQPTPEPGEGCLDMCKEALLEGVRCLQLNVWEVGRRLVVSPSEPALARQNWGVDTRGNRNYVYDPEAGRGLFSGPGSPIRPAWETEGEIPEGDGVSADCGDVFYCVDQFGFRHSPYPVILSLALFLSEGGQSSLADLLSDSLSHRLVRPDLLPLSPNASPQSLAGKVLVQVVGYNLDSEEGSAYTDFAEPLRRWISLPMSIGKEMESVLSIEIQPDDQKLKEEQHSVVLDQSLATELCEADGNSIRRRSRLALVRVAPIAAQDSRSANVSPVPLWILGSQMVGYRFKHYDSYELLQASKFRQNGGSGYLQKPAFLRVSAGKPQPAVQLRLRVLSGFALPLPQRSSVRGVHPSLNESQERSGGPWELSVRATLRGLQKETTERETEIVSGSLWYVQFDQELQFDVNVPDVAMLSLQVDCKSRRQRDRRCVLAEAHIPLTSLRLGYRSVPLARCSMAAEVEGRQSAPVQGGAARPGPGDVSLHPSCSLLAYFYISSQ